MGNQGSETLGDWLRVTQSGEDELGVLVALAASWGHPGLLALPHWASPGFSSLSPSWSSLCCGPITLHLTPVVSARFPTIVTQRFLVPLSSTPHTQSLQPSFQAMTNNNNNVITIAITTIIELLIRCWRVPARLSSTWFIHINASILKHSYEAGGCFLNPHFTDEVTEAQR